MNFDVHRSVTQPSQGAPAPMKSAQHSAQVLHADTGQQVLPEPEFEPAPTPFSPALCQCWPLAIPPQSASATPIAHMVNFKLCIAANMNVSLSNEQWRGRAGTGTAPGSVGTAAAQTRKTYASLSET